MEIYYKRNVQLGVNIKHRLLSDQQTYDEFYVFWDIGILYEIIDVYNKIIHHIKN